MGESDAARCREESPRARLIPPSLRHPDGLPPTETACELELEVETGLRMVVLDPLDPSALDGAPARIGAVAGAELGASASGRSRTAAGAAAG